MMVFCSIVMLLDPSVGVVYVCDGGESGRGEVEGEGGSV